MTPKPDFAGEAAQRLHWGSAELEWDGATDYTLVIPHYLHEWPVNWLARHAEGELALLEGCENVVIAISQARRSSDPNTAGWSEPGHITVIHLRSPFPDHGKLRETLSNLVAEAYRASHEAENEAVPFLRGIRSGR
jgi:hypothetical protein